MIRADAPGKIVLWGEYAVLGGAPALVQAVDRRAVCSLSPDGNGWQCSARGFPGAAATIAAERLLADPAPPPGAVWRLLWQVARTFEAADLPSGIRAEFDTLGFHQQGIKLGLGSSAALTTAIYAALSRLLDRPADLSGALAAHGQLQGGGAASSIRSGSGIDVAAAWYGGLLRYQRTAGPDAPLAAPWKLPASLHLVHVWSGVPASTPDRLACLERHLRGSGSTELDALSTQSQELFTCAQPLAALPDYVAALQALDTAAGLDIYTPPHRALTQLAKEAGVVYKPCGAGGGDIGVAFTDDAAAAARFARQAADMGFPPLPLETARHGIRVTP